MRFLIVRLRNFEGLKDLIERHDQPPIVMKSATFAYVWVVSGNWGKPKIARTHARVNDDYLVSEQSAGWTEDTQVSNRPRTVDVGSRHGGFMFVRVSAIGLVLCAVAMPTAAQQAPNGEAVFKQSCATCHRDGQTDAPTRDALRQMTPEAIFNALTLGRMILQATALSEAEQRAVSVFLAGSPLRHPHLPSS